MSHQNRQRHFPFQAFLIAHLISTVQFSSVHLFGPHAYKRKHTFNNIQNKITISMVTNIFKNDWIHTNTTQLRRNFQNSKLITGTELNSSNIRTQKFNCPLISLLLDQIRSYGLQCKLLNTWYQYLQLKYQHHPQDSHSSGPQHAQETSAKYSLI